MDTAVRTLRDEITDWVSELRSEMIDLVENRLVYRDLRSIVSANPDIQRPSIFYERTSRNYALVQTMTVRRLVDNRAGTRSLHALLARVAACPELLSRLYFRSLHTPERAATADRWFDKAAGEGLDALHRSVVESDRKVIRAVREEIKDFVNKKLAHIAPDRATVRLLTFDELESFTDRVLETFGRYNLLLTGDRPPLRSPREGTNWREIFKRPWIPGPAA